jgi:elongation factor P hydroxylase
MPPEDAVLRRLKTKCREIPNRVAICYLYCPPGRINAQRRQHASIEMKTAALVPLEAIATSRHCANVTGDLLNKSGMNY